MSDYLQRYLPEYDEEQARKRLAPFSREDLTEMLIRAYKEKRVAAKMLDEMSQKLSRIRDIADSPSELLKMPGVPTADQLRRMIEQDDEE